MTLTNLTGLIRFSVAGQKALPKWHQATLKQALESTEAPPESLRFQCRIAQDARDNLALVKLANGETLTLHGQARPQFGKNQDGHAFLTATMTYSGDGENYSIRWIGDAVPKKMQEVAVKHDKGLGVKPVIVVLDLAAAQVTPAYKAHGKAARAVPLTGTAKEKHAAKERLRFHAARKAGAAPRGKRTCARLTDADVPA